MFEYEGQRDALRRSVQYILRNPMKTPDQGWIWRETVASTAEGKWRALHCDDGHGSNSIPEAHRLTFNRVALCYEEANKIVDVGERSTSLRKPRIPLSRTLI